MKKIKEENYKSAEGPGKYRSTNCSSNWLWCHV